MAAFGGRSSAPLGRPALRGRLRLGQAAARAGWGWSSPTVSARPDAVGKGPTSR